jgi:hypothetical protein
MFDITAVQTKLLADNPTYKVDITADLFTTTKYDDPSVPVILINWPKIEPNDIKDCLDNNYSSYGTLLIGSLPVVIHCKQTDFLTVYNNIYESLQFFSPVPENSNYSNLVLLRGTPQIAPNNIIIYLTEWLYQFPRIV